MMWLTVRLRLIIGIEEYWSIISYSAGTNLIRMARCGSPASHRHRGELGLRDNGVLRTAGASDNNRSIREDRNPCYTACAADPNGEEVGQPQTRHNQPALLGYPGLS
jgi:hypothetical protein